MSIRPISVDAVKAWAVFYHFDSDPVESLLAFGSGNQSQYPTFPSRKETREWKREHCPNRGTIVRVTIRFSAERKGRGE